MSLSRLSRCACAASLLVALSAYSSAASAAELVEPSSGLHMPLDLPGATPCVLVPKGNDAVGCKGLDVDAAGAAFLKAAPKDATLALVRFSLGTKGAWSATVAGMSVATNLASAESKELFVKGVEDKTPGVGGAHLKAHGTGGAHFDVLKVGGLDALRYALDLGAAPGDARYGSAHRLFYSLAGDGLVATVAFESDPPHAAELDAVAAQMVTKLRMSPSTSPARARSVAELVGMLVGFMLIPALGLGLLIVFLSKKKKGPPAQPPNAWPR